MYTSTETDKQLTGMILASYSSELNNTDLIFFCSVDWWISVVGVSCKTYRFYRDVQSRCFEEARIFRK